MLMSQGIRQAIITRINAHFSKYQVMLLQISTKQRRSHKPGSVWSTPGPGEAESLCLSA